LAAATSLLVEFHEHATGVDVWDGRTGRPAGEYVVVELRCRTPVEPPARRTHADGTTGRRGVVVTVWSAEHHPVGVKSGRLRRRHCISGVSAVPVDRQLVLTNLITDGERRVFSPVPQTVSTINLRMIKQVSVYVLHARLFVTALVAGQQIEITTVMIKINKLL